MNKKRYKRRYRYCDCGKPARYKLRIMLYRSDLETEVHAILYLCESCLQLEQDLHSLSGKQPPKAIRLG